MKFECPKGIIKVIPVTSPVDGKEYILNKDKINEIYSKEYESRMVLLDLAFSIEDSLNKILTNIFIPKTELIYDTKMDFEMILLPRLTFDAKIEIFNYILNDELVCYHLIKNKNINLTLSEHKLINISQYSINKDKFIEWFIILKTIRNQCVHNFFPIAGGDLLCLHSKTKPFTLNQYNKDEVLIIGHFVTWILYLSLRENNIDHKIFYNYCKKYERILKSNLCLTIIENSN